VVKARAFVSARREAHIRILSANVGDSLVYCETLNPVKPYILETLYP
jgi:hypothetical protein